MSNNFQVTPGTGITIATELGVGGESYQKIKLIDPTVGATTGIGIAATPLRIDPTGTTTQPISGTVTANIGTTNGLALNSTLTSGNAQTQLVDGSGHGLNIDPSGTARVNVVTSTALTASISNFPATQAVTQSGTWTVQPGNTANTVAWKVDGSSATQPVSGTVTSNIGTTNGLALDSTLTGGNLKSQIVQGGNTALVSSAGALSIDINQIGTNALGQETMAASIPVVIASNQSSIPVTQSGSWTNTVTQATASNLNATVVVSNPVQVASSSLAVTATGTTGTAVTATLPAVASNFHYISLIEIVKYFTVANATSATPLVVTTTNLPGSLAWTFGQPLGTIGTTDKMVHAPNSPLKSSVVNTATTIVCPATTGIIWRVNVYYFSAS